MRPRRLEMVVKLVSMPPSHRLLTKGIPTLVAYVATTSWACFFVPMNRTIPSRRPRLRTNS